METIMNVMDEIERNDLLRALPEEQRRRLLPRLDRVELPNGHVLSDVGRRPAHVFFPTASVVTLHHVLKDCFSAEFAIVGREGAVGLDSMFSEKPSADRAVVLQGGSALRIDKRALKWEFFRSQELQQVLVQYTWSLMGFVAQTAVCNRHHCLDQRLCRWLLLAQDRLPGNQLVVTQEFLSHLLGVRREGVTQAAGRLQRAGLIRHRRGHVTILDRTGLEAGACECYETARRTVAPSRLPEMRPRPLVTQQMTA
jgi:CRP-like cAMP-binding protein